MGKTIRHFVGSESSKQLAFIDDLHTLGLNNTVELPEVSKPVSASLNPTNYAPMKARCGRGSKYRQKLRSASHNRNLISCRGDHVY
jgi:hypothetical protein